MMTVDKLYKIRESRKMLIRKLDRLVSQIVIARDQKCVTCGSVYRLTCGHLFSRVAYSIRWDLTNCHAQCLSCNFKHEHDSYPYNKFFITKYGQDAWDDLHRKWKTTFQWKDYMLKELFEELERLKV